MFLSSSAVACAPARFVQSAISPAPTSTAAGADVVDTRRAPHPAVTIPNHAQPIATSSTAHEYPPLDQLPLFLFTIFSQSLDSSGIPRHTSAGSIRAES